MEETVIAAEELHPIRRLLGIKAGAIYLLPVSGYPVSAAELKWVSEFCESVIGHVKSAPAELLLEVSVKQSCLYTGLLERFVDNAGRWIPQQGLAIIPHKAPPHLPTKEELEGIDPRSLDHANIGSSTGMPELVFLIKDETGKEECRRSMLGHGALDLFLSRLEEKELFDYWKEVFGRTVTDRLLASMPLFVPLYGIQSFQDASDDDIASWFGSFELYIGESKEDKGIVIATKKNLDRLMVSLAKQLPKPSAKPEEEVLRW